MRAFFSGNKIFLFFVKRTEKRCNFATANYGISHNVNKLINND